MVFIAISVALSFSTKVMVNRLNHYNYKDVLTVWEGYHETIIDGDFADVSLQQMDMISSNLDAYTNSLYDEIQNANPDLATTNIELQKLVPLIKVDMKSYFGVPITSQDTDGD